MPRAAPIASAVPTPVASTGPVADDWVTYAHDQARTGHQGQSTGISTTTASTLTKRWAVSLGEPIMASPLVANGFVYVAGLNGTVRALSVATGATVWQASLGGPIQMTPALEDGILFVGTHATPATFAALDAASGAVRWTASLPGAARGEPIVLNGTVYEGDASGDPPICNEGAMRGFNELTGDVTMTWHDDPTPNDGGGIWGPASTDGTSLYFGTGNTCSPGTAYSNSAVKLSTAGAVLWSHNEANPLSDDDFGTSLMIFGSSAYASDKNGLFYAFDLASGTIQWSVRLGSLNGYGAVGSPATDGTTIVTDGGYVHDPTSTPVDPGGLVYGLSRATGKVVWKIQTDDEVRGNTPIANGVAFVSMNEGLFALNEATGATLWSFPFANTTYASPAIVPSGVYDADQGGTVYAFGLPAQH